MSKDSCYCSFPCFCDTKRVFCLNCQAPPFCYLDTVLFIVPSYSCYDYRDESAFFYVGQTHADCALLYSFLLSSGLLRVSRFLWSTSPNLEHRLRERSTRGSLSGWNDDELYAIGPVAQTRYYVATSLTSWNGLSTNGLLLMPTTPTSYTTAILRWTVSSGLMSPTSLVPSPWSTLQDSSFLLLRCESFRIRWALHLSFPSRLITADGVQRHMDQPRSQCCLTAMHHYHAQRIWPHHFHPQMLHSLQ